MAKASKEMLAGDVLAGDVIQLPDNLNQFEVTGTEADQYASEDTVVVSLKGVPGPFAGASGIMRIPPGNKIKFVKKMPRPTVTQNMGKWIGSWFSTGSKKAAAKASDVKVTVATITERV